jgi:hypothetical protein
MNTSQRTGVAEGCAIVGASSVTSDVSPAYVAVTPAEVMPCHVVVAIVSCREMAR